MQTCMLTCAAVIQGVESFFVGWSLHGKIFILKDIMMTGVQNIVTGKHATYLEFPPLGFEPRTGFWPLKLRIYFRKTSPGGRG